MVFPTRGRAAATVFPVVAPLGRSSVGLILRRSVANFPQETANLPRSSVKQRGLTCGKFRQRAKERSAGGTDLKYFRNVLLRKRTGGQAGHLPGQFWATGRASAFQWLHHWHPWFGWSSRPPADSQSDTVKTNYNLVARIPVSFNVSFDYSSP